MKKINRRNFVAGAGALGAAAISGLAIPSASAQNAEFTLKWACPLPATHPSSIRIADAAEQIRRETKGRVQFQLFTIGQLGGDNEMLSQLRSGAIDCLLLSPVILATLVPVASVNGVGFAFKSYDEVWPAMDGDLGAYVRDAIGKVGLTPMEKIWDSGYRHITSSSKVVASPDDLKGFKIRVPVAPMWTSMFKALGAAPAGLAFPEVYSALQTRVMDGQENPLPIIHSSKIYEVQKHCSLTGHMWDGHWVLFNSKSWATLPKDVQALVARIINAVGVAQRDDIARLSATLVTQLTAGGMSVRNVDKTPFQIALRNAGFYAEWHKKFGDDVWVLLEKYTGKLS